MNQEEVDNESDRFLYVVTGDAGGVRLDVFLSSCPIGLSRSRIQALVKSGDIKVNDLRSKPSHRLNPGDEILVSIPRFSGERLRPQAIEFGIIYEDDSLIVVNKPAGLVVHPAPGHATGTLVHGLLQHCRHLSAIGGNLRPGIVHRLDKNTSGLMVAAKDDQAHAFLASQFKSGRVQKQYVALVHGRVKGDEGKVDLPITRHPKKRKEMSIALFGGRQALTLWRIIEKFHSGFSLLSISLETGRTHQIRVHLSHMGHPVAGDPVYGYGRNWWKRHPLSKTGMLPSISRQMLHAKHLAFVHPDHKRYLEFDAPIPDDMERAVRALKCLDLHTQADKELDISRKATIIK